MKWEIETVIAKHYLIRGGEKVTGYYHKKSNVIVPMTHMEITPRALLSMEEYSTGNVGKVLLDQKTNKIGMVVYHD